MQKSNAKNDKKKGVKKKTCDHIPENFESLQAAAEFWDTHDLTDYRDEFREVKDVKIDLIPRRVRVDDELAKRIGRLARQRGVSAETLMTLWLQQKLSEALKRDKRRQRVSSKRASASQYA